MGLDSGISRVAQIKRAANDPDTSQTTNASSSNTSEHKRLKTSDIENTSDRVAKSLNADICYSTGYGRFQASIEDLCQICKKNNLSALPTICELPSLQNDTKCPFCLFFNNARVNPRKDLSGEVVTYKLQTFSVKTIFGLESPMVGSIMFAVVPGVVKQGQWIRQVYDEDLARSNSCFMRFQPSLDGISVRLISSYVDFGFVKQWLNFCETHHTERCKLEESPTLPGFRLIDCTTRQLIAWPSTEWIPSYLTLSYVWGSHVAMSAEDVNMLPSELPQLIKDAIEVTTRLGYTYLWVDRYCVPQEDERAKHAQIHSMDQIYSRSTVTIIASAGNSPDQGFPGVRDARTRRQNYLKVGNQGLLQVLASVADDIQGSEWNARGWTYQEGIVAHRKLVFTSSQVYFQCSGMWCTEGLSYPLKRLHTDDLQKFHEARSRPGSQRFYEERLPRAFPRQRVGQDLDSPIIRIEEYSQKRFTFERDALDAFRGVLNKFRTSKTGPLQGHICGVPLWYSNSCQTSLIHSLQWRQGDLGRRCKPRILAERRKEFPSWSWLGWIFSPNSTYGFCMAISSQALLTGKLPAEVDQEVMDLTEVSIEYDNGEVLRWSSHEYEKAISMSLSGCNARLLRVRGFVGNFTIPGLDAIKMKGPFDIYDADAKQRAGPYLFRHKHVERLHQIAIKRNMLVSQNGYSFMCWVMQRYEVRLDANRFALMALMPAPEACSFERVDVFDIVYDPDNKNQRFVDIPRMLGWEMRDIIIR